MDVLFYHLTETKVEDALPALLERSLERNWRVVVQTAGTERRDLIDGLLWTYRPDSFLPHGLDTDPFPEMQPILLTAGEGNPNAATVRFVIDGAPPPALSGYERVVFMFDGHDAAQVEGARGHWKALKGEGHSLSYWQQNRDGRWEKKA